MVMGNNRNKRKRKIWFKKFVASKLQEGPSNLCDIFQYWKMKKLSNNEEIKPSLTHNCPHGMFQGPKVALKQLFQQQCMLNKILWNFKLRFFELGSKTLPFFNNIKKCVLVTGGLP